MTIRLLLLLIVFVTFNVVHAGEDTLLKSFESNNYESFLRLYEASPDKSKVIDKDGHTYGLLSLSFYVEDPRFFERLIVEADPNVASEGGYTALFEAASFCDSSRAERLVEHNADVNHVSEGGLTALHLAVLSSCYSVVEYLLVAGAFPDVATFQGKRPVESARNLGDGRMVRLLEP